MREQEHKIHGIHAAVDTYLSLNTRDEIIFNQIITNSFPEPLANQASFTGYHALDILDFHIANHPCDSMRFHGSFRSRLLGLSKVNQEIGRTILQPPESIESNQFRKEFQPENDGVICQIPGT